jgi:peptidoglycan/LPS O-acetylase OafA/YrhL
MTESQQPRIRIGHIDSIRGIAALMVAWMHSSAIFVQMQASDTSGILLYQIPQQLDFGRIGVIAFFAISGFVICPSLKGGRTSGAGRFVISRFFRLYPAFWISMACAILILFILRGREVDLAQVAGNIPMLYSVFGADPLLGLYWTLEVELIFYCLCLIIFLLGWLQKPLALFAVCLCLMWLQNVVNNDASWREAITEAFSQNWNRMPWHLAIMFWGGLFRIWYGDRRGVIPVLGVQVPKVLPVAILLPIIFWRPLTAVSTAITSGGEQVHWGMIAYVWGILLFLVGALWIRLNYRIFVWLGAISYSLYLLHPLAARLLKYVIVQHFPAYADAPLAVTLLASLLLAVLMSACAYYCVEKPSISVGRKLQAKWFAGAQANPQTSGIQKPISVA